MFSLYAVILNVDSTLFTNSMQMFYQLGELRCLKAVEVTKDCMKSGVVVSEEYVLSFT
jgi:hypothetical protein